MKSILILSIIFISGCASFNGDAKVVEIENGVKFEAMRPTKMTYKKGDVEYTYDSQAQSLLSRILSAMTLGVVGARK